MRMRRMVVCQRQVASLLLLSGCFIFAGGARAVPRAWLGGDGDWFHAASWDPEGIPESGDSVQIASGTVLLTNTTPELTAFSIGNATLTFSNAVTTLRAGTVSIQAGGILNHAPVNSAVTPVETNRVAIVCHDLTLDPLGTINVNVMGFRGGGTGQDGQGPGRGFGSATHGAQYGGGAGYGGRGGFGNYRSVRGMPYGVPENPAAPGSGGGRSGGTGHGGGLVRIEATGTVTVNGIIEANGGHCSHTHGGGGSGGGIYVEAAVFGGSGQLTANGGNGGSANGGGGGGGRIALHYADVGVTIPVMSARRGVGGAADGLIGTLYFPDVALQTRFSEMSGFIHIPTNLLVFPGSLLIDNAHPGFALDSGQVRIEGHLTFTNGGALHLQASAVPQPTDAGGRLIVTGDLTVSTGSTVFVHSNPTNGGSYRLQVGNLTVNNGGAIRANGLGFLGGSSARRNGYGPGRGEYIASRNSGSGAGYGGRGQRNHYADTGHRGAIYGKPLAPIEPGSGGASGDVTYLINSGGGLIWIEAMGPIINNGVINADGVGYSSPQLSGASGGGILLTGEGFSGSGVLSARGSEGLTRGGGGGRITVWVPRMPEDVILQIAQDMLPRKAIIEETIPWDGTSSVDFGTGNTTADAESGTIRYGHVPAKGASIIMFR